MIGEIIKAQKGTRNNAKGLINYITGVTKSADDAVDFVAAKNIIDKETAIAEMNAVVAQNIRTKNPFMHFVLSWKEREKPSIPQAIEAAKHAIRALGFQDHQFVVAGHKDTQNYHIHIAINRIHPQTFKANYPAWSHKTLSKAVREIEIMQGWEHDSGIYSVVEVSGEKHIILTPKNKSLSSLNGNASKMEQHTGIESFKTFVKHNPAKNLTSVLKKSNATWHDVHATLAEYNLMIITKGSGLVISDRDEPELVIKASEVSRLLSKSKLEKQLGEFVASTVTNKTVTKGRYRDPEKRDHKRLIRKIEREDLYQRFLIQRNHQISFYMQQKSLIWAKQKDSEKQRYEIFRRDMKTFKKETYTRSNLPKKVLIGLIARERAARKEALNTQIKKERAALRFKLPPQDSLSWRRWLEQNAPHNHAAASTLRGLRYRNQHNNSDEAKSRIKEVPKTALLSPTSHSQSSPAPGEPLQIADFGTKILFDNSIAYLRADSSTAFIDTGYIISLHDRQDDSLQAALKVAKEKWAGGPLVLTGDENFKLQAAKIAAALNIEISNPELESYLSQLKRQKGQLQNNAEANTTPQNPMKIG